MTIPTLQAFAAHESDPHGYWRWRLMLALTDQGTMPPYIHTHSPREGREPGRRGWAWHPGNVVG